MAAAVFLAGAFLVVAVVFDLVTRPDLVLPRILGSSTTAGAWRYVSNIARGEDNVTPTAAGAAFAGFLARGFAVLALVVVAVFLVAGAFFVVVAAFAVFFGAAFLAAGAALGLVSLASFYAIVSNGTCVGREMVRTFGAAGLAAAGLASFFASFTGPDGPVKEKVS